VKARAVRTIEGAALYEGPALTDPHGCCVECGVAHPPDVDEYYFWLQDTRHFKNQLQDADVQVPGVDNSVQGAWHTQDATILRAPTDDARHEEMRRFIDDLKKIWKALAG